MRPERIADAVAAKVEKVRAARTAATSGSSSPTPTAGRAARSTPYLEREGIERIEGAHCYEFYAGAGRLRRAPGRGARHVLPDRLPGPPVRLDHHGAASASTAIPSCCPIYFGNYRRLVYLAQTDDPELTARARAAADRLGLAFERRVDRLRRPRPVHPARRRRSRLTCRHAVDHLVARHPAQVVAKDARRSSKVVLHPRFQVAIDKAANRAGKREYNAYIGEWRKTQRAVRRRPRGRGQGRSRSASRPTTRSTISRS